MSKASDAKTPQGDNNYYADVIFNKSSQIFWMDHNSAGTNWGSAATGITLTTSIGTETVSADATLHLLE